MPTYSTEFAESLIPGIYEYWDVGAGMIDSKIPQIFNVRSTTRAWEEVVAVGGYDPSSFTQYRDTGRVGQLDNRKGYTKRFTPDEYTADIVIERKLVDDGGLTEMAFSPAEEAGTTFARLKELMAADLFNNAHAAGDYVLPDGKALLANDHPLGPSNAGATHDNLDVGSLTKARLRAARQKMMRFVDDRGQIDPSIGRMILVPPELAETAMQLAMSRVEVGAPNDAQSPDAMMNYQVVVWPYLTDTSTSGQRWFLIDPVKGRRVALFLNRVMPQIRFEPSKSNQVQLVYSAYARFDLGFADWRWIYGSST
ncbi:MAG: hypothetical protein OXI23_09725 [Gemmatimonadota bacterium]|nr:hypothetical protein [Gemmatimonadota bacterium]MDE2734897.1 hypothetical protein [Gemmatimonadota bacterium]